MTTGVHQFAEQTSDERVDDGSHARPSTADDSHDPALLPECAQSTQYRKQRMMLLTRPRSSPQHAHARKMRGAFMTRSATKQPWPRRTNCTNATRDVLGKAEALENHVKTVTMRAGSPPHHAERLLPKGSSSGTKRLRNHLNALSAQLHTTAPSLSICLSWKISASFQSQLLFFFSVCPGCQMNTSLKSDGLVKHVRRTRDRAGTSHARSTIFASFSSDSSSSPDTTPAEWYETSTTRVALSQATRRSGPSDLAETQLRPKRTRLGFE